MKLALAILACCLLSGCADVPLKSGKARIWFPMKAILDSDGNVVAIGPDEKATDTLAHSSPELLERGMEVWTRLHPDKNAAEVK